MHDGVGQTKNASPTALYNTKKLYLHKHTLIYVYLFP